MESLAERTGPDDEPPVVRVIGPVPYGTLKSTVRWRVQSIDEDEQFTSYSPGGRSRIRFACAVVLVQHVTDKQLAQSLRKGKQAQGIGNRKTKARAGEFPSDVARRIYGDPSRASDIVRANPGMRLGKKLREGENVRLPA